MNFRDLTAEDIEVRVQSVKSNGLVSLNDYNFNKAVDFFENSEELRRNEILQQFANDGERKIYRDSNLTAEQLEKIVNIKRKQVADEIVS